MTHLKRFVFFVLVVALLALPATQALAFSTAATTPTFLAFQEVFRRVVVFLASGSTLNPTPPATPANGPTMDPDG